MHYEGLKRARHGKHYVLPGPRGDFRVARGEVRASNLAIDSGLSMRLVLGVQEGGRFRFVPRVQAGLLTGFRVLAVEHAGAAIQGKRAFIILR